MASTVDRISENIAAVREKVAAAAARSGRAAEAVQLVAVTKYGGPELCAAVCEAGLCDLGENRPQAMWDKAEALNHLPIRWHFIGNLQRNKARRTWPLLARIHAVDSVKLLTTLDRLVAETGANVPALLEVNVSGDESKHGFLPEHMPALAEPLGQLEHLRIDGLMAMAAGTRSRDDARRDFVQLRELRDQLKSIYPANFTLDQLSMGMSGDYDIAIEEGSTIVRVGSALYEGVLD